MKIVDLTDFLETIAPLSLQESYDNAGLIVGDPGDKIKGILISLDATEAVVDEAIKRKCNVIVSHHPIVFRALKKISGATYVERVLLKAIKNNIALYAIHTNLDNVIPNGVNQKIAEQLGVQNCSPIIGKYSEVLLNILCTEKIKSNVLNQLTKSYSDKITELSVQKGKFSFIGNGSQKYTYKIEVSVSTLYKAEIYKELDLKYGNLIHINHQSSKNPDRNTGSGIIGQLDKPMKCEKFFELIKTRMKVQCIRHTTLVHKYVQNVAICGGAGSFLLDEAKRKNAEIFISADFKYHEFFDAEDRIIIADIGHFESEQYTIDLIYELISKKFSTFAPLKSKLDTNPIKYFS